MSFIGIIAENKDFKFIKNNILSKIKKDTTKLEIININNNSIDNIKNVRFETVAVCSRLDKFKDKKKSIENI